MELVEKNPYHLVNVVKVNPNYISVYETLEAVNGVPPKIHSSTFGINFHDNFHDMQMSPAAVKTIKKSVNIILYLAKKRHDEEFLAALSEWYQNHKIGCTSHRKNNINYLTKDDYYKELAEFKKTYKNKHLCTFVTLTLPAAQQHTDVEITKYCLNPFFSYCRKFFKVRYFAWKKELQKNGNLHFHIVTDRYIDHECLRIAWNRVLDRGVVEGVEKPFDYVTRYQSRMFEFFKDGWNPKKMFDYYCKSDKVHERAANDFKDISAYEMNAAEYNQAICRYAQVEYDKGLKNYLHQIDLPEELRWRNPNSTDISAVHSAKSVSAYVAKYLTKDVSDCSEVVAYQQEVLEIKQLIIKSLYAIKEREENGEKIEDFEREKVESLKAQLAEIRKKKCKIKGRLWFKSETLTPFLSGAASTFDTYIANEVNDLTEYLQGISTEENPKILYNYALDEDGKPTDKVICTTLLIDVFTLQKMKLGNTKLKRFPELSMLWDSFITQCINENAEKGLYEYDKDFVEFENL